MRKKSSNNFSFKPNSFSSRLLEAIEFIVGLHYTAFTRKSLGYKLRMDPQWEGHKIIRTLLSLERGKFIERVDRDKYKLTKKGMRRIQWQKLSKIALNSRKKDGLFRVLIFDIEETEKLKRELLRKKLKEFGFRMIQRSVFVSPYACEDGVKELCSILGLDKEVTILLAKSLNKNLGGLEKWYK